MPAGHDARPGSRGHQTRAVSEGSDEEGEPGRSAVRLLVAEGFVESRSGSGSYVRQRPQRQRLSRSWYTTREGGSAPLKGSCMEWNV